MTLRVSYERLLDDRYGCMLPLFLPVTPAMAEAHASAAMKVLRMMIVCMVWG